MIENPSISDKFGKMNLLLDQAKTYCVETCKSIMNVETIGFTLDSREFVLKKVSSIK